MSQPRHSLTVEQEPFLTVRSAATGCSSGLVIAPHRHPWHQLVYAVAGAMTVQAGRFSWMTPPGKAVFVPAGQLHSIRMWGNVAMRSLYFPPTLEAFEDTRVLTVSPLLRELILRVIDLSGLDSRQPSHSHLRDTILDEMREATVEPLMLPMPTDPRALTVANHVLANPAGTEGLGSARRTLERLFSRETGLSFGLWKQKARLLESLRFLAEGHSVTDASFEAGYSSVSAYIAAFKQTFGCTPNRLKADSAHAPLPQGRHTVQPR